jgi:diamine N-acetyltransferase
MQRARGFICVKIHRNPLLLRSVMRHPTKLFIQQRLATPQDIDFFLQQEAREEFRSLIGQWSRDEHTSNLSDPDKQYLIFERETGESIGYAILSGVQSTNRSITLARIVIARPNQGYGKQALQLVLQQAFETHHAHRLCLDVFEHNRHAQRVYQAIGFRPEGMLREAVKQEETYRSIILMSMLEQEYRLRQLASV